MKACLANFEKVYPSKEAALAAFGPQNFSAIAHTPLHLPAQKARDGPGQVLVAGVQGQIVLAQQQKHAAHDELDQNDQAGRHVTQSLGDGGRQFL